MVVHKKTTQVMGSQHFANIHTIAYVDKTTLKTHAINTTSAYCIRTLLTS